MPLLNDLDFVRDHLSVAYRGSETPQELTIRVRVTEARRGAFGPRFIVTLRDLILCGAAGGHHFSPATGAAELLSGPEYPEGEGPEFEWILRVDGVSPLFLRSVVEALRLSGGWENPVIEMSLFGSLPLDASELSVNEAHIKAWLDDPLAYVQEWPTPGFPISEREAFGASLRIRLADKLDKASQDLLQAACLQWIAGTYNYMNLHGEPILDAPERLSRLMPKFAVTKRELRAFYEEFTRSRVPARAVIVNLLTRFHLTVCPIEDVQLAL